MAELPPSQQLSNSTSELFNSSVFAIFVTADIDPKYFTEKYGIPVLGKREAALPEPDLVKQLTAGDTDFFA